MTKSFVTNAVLIQRAVSCWRLRQLISQTTQYLDSWLSDLLQSELKMELLEVEGARVPVLHSWRRHWLWECEPIQSCASQESTEFRDYIPPNTRGWRNNALWTEYQLFMYKSALVWALAPAKRRANNFGWFSLPVCISVYLSDDNFRKPWRRKFMRFSSRSSSYRLWRSSGCQGTENVQNPYSRNRNANFDRP